MTLIYQNTDLPDDAPQLHALIIGCGRFPHLGANADRKACADSAVKIAEFLLDPATLLTTPIGTIEMMLSDPDKEQGQDTFPRLERYEQRPDGDIGVEPALGATVENVVHEWADRCDSDRGDQLFFYGCSHGVTDRDRTGLMVLEDAKSNDNAPWKQLLNVATMADWIPPKKEPAGSWFFLDACQEVVRGIVDQLEGEKGIQPIRATTRELGQFNERGLPKPVALGVAYGQKTFAPPGGGTAYFTEALLYGLANSCVEFKNGEYFTVGKKVVEGVSEIAKAHYNRKQSTTAFGQDSFQARYTLCRVLEPKVPVRVTRSGIGGLRGALPLRVLKDDVVFTERDPAEEGDTWAFEAPITHRHMTLEMQIDGLQIHNEMQIDPPAHIHEVYGDEE